MKNILMKVTAGISAATLSATLSATTIPAFASEYEVQQEANLVSSYAVDDEQLAAQYFLDIGYSLEETRDLMETYIESEATTRSGGTPYYDQTMMNDTEHFVAFIYSKPSSAQRRITISLSADTQSITNFGTGRNALTYKGYTGSCSSSGSYIDDASGLLYQDITYSNLKAIPNFTNPRVFGIASISYTNSIHSEAQLYNTIDFDYTLSSSNQGVLYYGTYARADINHDYSIDTQDWNILTTYLARLNAGSSNADEVFEFDYFSGVHAQKYLSMLAADIDMDGDLDNDDVTLFQKVVSGQVEL